ncbi:hypothetical protein DNTS_002617, partial [Danionella cerebrum]
MVFVIRCKRINFIQILAVAGFVDMLYLKKERERERKRERGKPQKDLQIILSLFFVLFVLGCC